MIVNVNIPNRFEPAVTFGMNAINTARIGQGQPAISFDQFIVLTMEPVVRGWETQMLSNDLPEFYEAYRQLSSADKQRIKDILAGG